MLHYLGAARLRSTPPPCFGDKRVVVSWLCARIVLCSIVAAVPSPLHTTTACCTAGARSRSGSHPQWLAPSVLRGEKSKVPARVRVCGAFRGNYQQLGRKKTRERGAGASPSKPPLQAGVGRGRAQRRREREREIRSFLRHGGRRNLSIGNHVSVRGLARVPSAPGA